MYISKFLDIKKDADCFIKYDQIKDKKKIIDILKINFKKLDNYPSKTERIHLITRILTINCVNKKFIHDNERLKIVMNNKLKEFMEDEEYSSEAIIFYDILFKNNNIATKIMTIIPGIEQLKL